MITVTLDFPAQTITFAKNGACPGIAFRNLTGPVRAAASLTPTNAQVQVRASYCIHAGFCLRVVVVNALKLTIRQQQGMERMEEREEKSCLI